MSDDDYNYSDSFVSDDEPDRRHKGTGARNQKKVYSVGNKRSFGTMRGRGGKQQSRSSSQADRPDGVVQRMLSAKNLKINELRNQLEDLQTALRDVKEENKLLKKMQHRQEKALTKYEDTESELPQIMQRHQNEVKTLRENLRKTREKYERTDRYLRDAEDELDKVKSKLKRYKSLADQQNLLEREDLQKKNHQMEIDMEERDVKVKDLEKHINNLNKNHRHELGIEIARNRELQKQIEQLRHQNDDLEKNVKEKEKEIQIKNIYANRARAVPHRLPASYGGTPHDTPPPKPRKRAPSLHDLTPREKVKMYEEKRREEEKRLREKQARGGKTGNAFHFTAEPEDHDFIEEKFTVGPQNERRPQHDRLSSSFNEKSRDSYVKFGSGDSRSRDFSRKDDDIHDFDSRPWYENNSDHSSTYRKSNADKRGRATHHRFDNVNTHAARGARDYGKPPLPSGNKGHGFKFSSNFDQPEQQEKSRREREEREQEEMDRKRAEERERQERLDWERREKERFEREDRERREREQREKEEEDWRLTLERERLKREQEDRDREMREKEERLRKEREEKDRRDRERREQERRAHEEMERKKMDKQEEEERKRKDDLLARLKQIDDGQNKLLTTNTSKPETKKEEPVDSFFLTSGRVKEKDTNSLGSATSSKHSYTFTKPVENLHSGKPSREDNSKQKKKKEGLDEFGGGYQPSFGGGTTQKPSSKKTSGSVLFNDDFTSTSKAKPKNNKKSNLMADLFGDQTSKSKNYDDDDDDIFKPSNSSKKSTNVNSTTKSSFLWDDDDSTTTKKPPANKRENSTSALFAGGTAFIEDDVSQKNDSKMLPRRPRQTTTFAARPAVTAVDHYDDDIEEVIL